MSLNRDGLASCLRTAHESVVREAEEWRPLATHVLELNRRGLLGPTEREERLEAALREIEFGNDSYDDLCPMCGKARSRGHLPWCRIGLALAQPGADAGAEE